jgi:hypothetical protein
MVRYGLSTISALSLLTRECVSMPCGPHRAFLIVGLTGPDWRGTGRNEEKCILPPKYSGAASRRPRPTAKAG